MQQYQYILEKGSKKHICPGCEKKSLVRYLNSEDGNYLPEQYGRCDRESKCGYNSNPYNDGYTNWNSEQRDYNDVRQKQYARARVAVTPAPVYIPAEVFSKTLKNYEQNNFIQNHLNRVAYPFTISDIEKVISLYYLGTITNGYRAGAVTFPFIDNNGNIRAIQVKQFDNTNHTTGTDFLHSIIEKHHARNKQPLPYWLEEYKKQDKRISCVYGEHLLSKYPLSPVALVEAPKTAIYGSLYFGFPDAIDNFIWLAVYNKSSFTFDKLKALKGRDVYVFPDLSKDGGTFNEWKRKAEAMEKQLPGTRFIFSDLLEELAPQEDRKDGSDIADFLIKLDWRNFRENEGTKVNQQLSITSQASEKSEKGEHLEKPFICDFIIPTDDIETIQSRPNWDKQIEDFETFFSADTRPITTIHLKQYSITDINKMVKSHLTIVKANNGNRIYLPYLERLLELKQLITETLNNKVSTSLII